MINANDGGATVTFDGAKTWSSINNQPTAQFYRVNTDNQFPYRIYGGQQDNSTVAIASRSFTGGIGVDDFFAVGGGESAHIAFDPDNPRLIYATTINGTLTEYDRDTEMRRSIIPYPELVYGKDSRDLKYRANWNPPVALSPHDPNVIYYGTQLVLKSTDRGTTWTEISPDLTRNNPDRQGRNGGPLTPENVGAEFYNTLFYIVESPLEKGTMWVGSDDGLVHLSRDGGGTWNNISPRHRGDAMVNSIELSPHDAGTAYVVLAGYKLNDFRPYIYKTTDYGNRWQRIDDGLPADNFVRVVREDPTRKGLLYAGTEAGMFVSFNDGDDWQSLDLNLPPVPITDLRIQNGNLVAATQGRAFWVLDDLFTIRQAAADIAEKALHVYSPGTIYMIGGSGSAGDLEGKNPSSDVPLYYYLKEEAESPLSIDILDNTGTLIRHFSSEESDHDRCRTGNMDPRRPFEIEYPTTDEGLNKWSWNLRRESIRCIPDIALFAGFDGPRVLPGNYSAKISSGDFQETVKFTLQADPRSVASDAEMRTWGARLNEVSNLMNRILTSLDDLRTAREQIDLLMQDYAEDAPIQETGRAAVERIGQWEAKITQLKHQTYEDEDGWETMLAGQLRYLLDVIDDTGAPVTEGAITRLNDLQLEWAQREAELGMITEEYLQPINAWAREVGTNHVLIPRSH